MVRRNGRAPSTGSKPRLANSDLALSVSSMAMSLLLSCFSTRPIIRSTIWMISSRVSWWKTMMSSMRLRNSGPEVLLQLVVDLLLHPLVVVVAATLGEAEPDRLGDVGRAQVRREDQHGVLEVDRAALAVGEPAVLEHLQQAVVDLLVRLLDLIEQHHRERLAPHLLGELAALLVADVAGRGTEQPRSGEAVVELAHVDLDERVVVAEQEVRQRLGQLGLTRHRTGRRR